jgi:Skp family chaperone for outer membrane proteins
MKHVSQLLAGVLAATLIGGAAYAENIGVVDTQLIAQKYTKAVTVGEQVKSREQELQTLRDNLSSELKKSQADKKMSPVEKKTEEDKLNNEFAAKFKEYRDWAVTQENGINADMSNAIKAVATAKSLDVVLPKQVVMQGGTDITQDVLNSLNK